MLALTSRPCDLYVITTECKTYIKVGISQGPSSRLKDIQSHCPLKLSIKVYPCDSVIEAAWLEKHIHLMLREHKKHFEWFFNNNEVQKTIEKIIESTESKKTVIAERKRKQDLKRKENRGLGVRQIAMQMLQRME